MPTNDSHQANSGSGRKLLSARRHSARRESAWEPSQGEQQFQIVWRALCFQVGQHSLGRQVRAAVERLIKRWSADDSAECKYQLSSKCEDPNGRPAGCAEDHADGRVIFDNLNGHIRSGEITAILGPSGAGKTSLLNAICGFDTQNYTGSIQLLGGGHRKRMQLSLIPQKDYLVGTLTVHDNLLFSSRILNAHNTAADHEANIARVVKMLNLADCLDTDCKNLSGGEYKRVSIAQELLREPDILVLDEPTSGLDSLNCKQLIKTLRGLIEASNKGVISPMAIVMTIHQPDVEIYSMFDHVYCLAPGGRVIFEGHPRATKDELETRGGLVADEYRSANPANLLIEIASGGRGEDALDRLAAHQREQFAAYLKSVSDAGGGDTACVAVPNQKASPSEADGGAEQENDICLKPDLHASAASEFIMDKRLESSRSRHRGLFWYQTWLLTQRAFISTIRDPMTSVMSLIYHLTVPLVVWAVFSTKIGRVTGCPQLVREMSFLAVTRNETHSRLQDMIEDMRVAYEGITMLFLVTYSLSLCCHEVASLTFPLHMHILLKEVRNGWYGTSTFILSKTIANFPFEVMFPVISVVICYYLLEMPSSPMQWRLVFIALVMAVTAMVSTTQGLVFGAIFMNDAQAAVFVTTAFTLPQMLLSGFLARVKNMPRLLQHMSWLSQYRYSFNLNTMFTYGFGRCQCEPDTDSYLRANRPKIIDVPKRMKTLYKLYLNRPADAAKNVTVNSTQLVQPILKHIPGISYDLVLNATEENKLHDMLETDRLDLFDEIPKLVSRLFSYGRVTDNCQSVRSIVLSGLPPDDWAPYIFGLFIGLLLAWKLLLFSVVWIKIGSRT